MDALECKKGRKCVPRGSLMRARKSQRVRRRASGEELVDPFAKGEVGADPVQAALVARQKSTADEEEEMPASWLSDSQKLYAALGVGVGGAVAAFLAHRKIAKFGKYVVSLASSQKVPPVEVLQQDMPANQNVRVEKQESLPVEYYRSQLAQRSHTTYEDLVKIVNGENYVENYIRNVARIMAFKVQKLAEDAVIVMKAVLEGSHDAEYRRKLSDLQKTIQAYIKNVQTLDREEAKENALVETVELDNPSASLGGWGQLVSREEADSSQSAESKERLLAQEVILDQDARLKENKRRLERLLKLRGMAIFYASALAKSNEADLAIRVHTTLKELNTHAKYARKALMHRFEAFKRFLRTNHDDARTRSELWDAMTLTLLSYWRRPRAEDRDVTNYIIYGLPGTGKTRLAGNLALFLRLGGIVINYETPIETLDSSAFKAMHYGQSEKITEKKLHEQREDVLYIDEAQTLGGSGDSASVEGSVFSKLMRYVGAHPRGIICIMTGYKEGIQSRLFGLDIGAKKRFVQMEVKPFTPNVLAKIFFDSVYTRGIHGIRKVRPQIREMLLDALSIDGLFRESAASVLRLHTFMEIAVLDDLYRGNVNGVLGENAPTVLTQRVFLDGLGRFAATKGIDLSKAHAFGIVLATDTGMRGVAKPPVHHYDKLDRKLDRLKSETKAFEVKMAKLKYAVKQGEQNAEKDLQRFLLQQANLVHDQELEQELEIREEHKRNLIDSANRTKTALDNLREKALSVLEAWEDVKKVKYDPSIHAKLQKDAVGACEFLTADFFEENAILWLKLQDGSIEHYGVNGKFVQQQKLKQAEVTSFFFLLEKKANEEAQAEAGLEAKEEAGLEAKEEAVVDEPVLERRDASPAQREKAALDESWKRVKQPINGLDGFIYIAVFISVATPEKSKCILFRVIQSTDLKGQLHSDEQPFSFAYASNEQA